MSRFKDKARKKIISQAIKISSKISDKNLIKLTYLGEKITKTDDGKECLRNLREICQLF